MSGKHSSTPGHVIEDTLVPACKPWSAEVHKGDVVRLIDLEGQPPLDFRCYNLAITDELYNAANTIKLNSSI